MRSWIEFFGRFARLAGPYWSSPQRWTAAALTAALVGLTILQAGVPVALNLWTGDLFDALAGRSFERFLPLIGVLALIILANIAVVTTHLRVKRRLQIGWRDWLTRQMTEQWMADGRHYQVTYLPGEHDNPDGRIAEDVRITTEYAIDLCHSLFYVLLLATSFTGILWVLSGDLAIPLGGLAVSVPGHLVWVALAYSALGTSVALLLGRPLVQATDRRQTREADFRFGLVHARESSLAIALARGETVERRRFGLIFGLLTEAWDRQTTALARIFIYISSWSVLTQVFPVLVAAPRYIAGTISLGALMQTAQAFQQMMAALSWPVDNLAKLADWRASVERVLGLGDALARLARPAAEDVRPAIEIATVERPCLALVGLTVATAAGEPLVAPFTLEVGRGDRLLVAGEPGAALALFKAIAGLWPWGSGRIELPAEGALLFMPQRPYLPIGTLREAICHPAPAGRWSDAAIAGALARVGLAELAPRLDEAETWERALTGGQQQRLAFARALLARPAWIVAHEATAALDAAGERAMIGLLVATLPEATLVTFSEDPALAPFHGRRLALERLDGVTVAREVAPALPS